MTIYTVASDFHQNVQALTYLFDHYSDTQIVLLGDFFDTHGGSDHNANDMRHELVKLVDKAPIKPFIITGNHDDFIIGTSFYKSEQFDNWMLNGGKTTLRELGYRGSKNLYAVGDFLNEHCKGLLDTLKMGKYIINLEYITFVHAGLDWTVQDPIHETLPDIAMWIREPYLFQGRDEYGRLIAHENLVNKTIVSGHTPIFTIDHNSNKKIMTLHHPNDTAGINRYLIDGGSGSGVDSAHVNIVQFNDQGVLINEDKF